MTEDPESVVMSSQFSLVSRGTERLVLNGQIPPSEYDRMRCPHQAGTFQFPVKYGYALVGTVTGGPGDLAGRTVFALHPHQSVAALGADAVTVVPEAIPARRATLAANMETALNVVWDSAVSLGDDVLVVGAGVVGLLIARLLARIPGTRVSVCDRDGSRAEIVEAFGARFATHERVGDGFDIAINATGNDAGLRIAIAATAMEGRVVEASWHGARQASVDLGGPFHARRLSIKSSQVGVIPPDRVPRWGHKRRLAAVMRLLDDPLLDRLFTAEVPLHEAPARLPDLMRPDAPQLAILITYPANKDE
ncbi:MAG: zinc-binding alcohol dehydrogenase [Pseudomonadota bacterium]